jgi:hypothetical protein
MRVDEAGQDELARRVDDRVVRAPRSEPAIGGPTWAILLPSTTTSVFGTGSHPLPSINVPFSIDSRG